MKAIEASKILNRIVDIDKQLEIAKEIQYITLHSRSEGTTLKGDQARLLAAYWRKDLLETRERLVEQINKNLIEARV